MRVTKLLVFACDKYSSQAAGHHFDTSLPNELLYLAGLYFCTVNKQKTGFWWLCVHLLFRNIWLSIHIFTVMSLKVLSNFVNSVRAQMTPYKRLTESNPGPIVAKIRLQSERKKIIYKENFSFKQNTFFSAGFLDVLL